MTVALSSPTAAVLVGLAPSNPDGGTQSAETPTAWGALSPILGRSPFQRHVRQLVELGVSRIVIPVPGQDTSEALHRLCRRQAAEVLSVPPDLSFPSLAGATKSLGLEADEPVALVLAGQVIDPRLYRAAFSADSSVWIGDHAVDSSGQAAGFDVVGLRIARLDVPESPAEDPLECLRGTDQEVLLVGDLDAYIPNLRRTLRPYWTHTRDAGDRERAASLLLDATQKGVLDFPARFLHPPPENFLVRLLSRTPITPNQITVLTGVIGFAAAGLFAIGSYAPALATALLVNVLDGVDGKLARVKLLASRFGDRLDHILDVLFEFSWYLGLGWGLSGGDPSGTLFLLGVGLMGVMLGSRAMSGVYKRISGRQIHDHRAFDRGFRLVAGRRNIYIVILVAGALLGNLSATFLFCFAWSVVTLGVYMLRSAMAAVGWIEGGEGQLA